MLFLAPLLDSQFFSFFLFSIRYSIRIEDPFATKCAIQLCDREYPQCCRLSTIFVRIDGKVSEIEKKVCTCARAVYSLIGRFDGGKKRNPTGENRFHSREIERLSIHCRYLQIAANSMSRSLVRGRINSQRGLSSLNPLLIRGILCFSKRSAKTSSFVVHKKFLTRGSLVKQANIWTFLSDIDLI